MYKIIKQRISKGDLIYEDVIASFDTQAEAEKYYLVKIKGTDPEEGFRWSDWTEYQIIERE
jgi:hypothetical protein